MILPRLFSVMTLLGCVSCASNQKPVHTAAHIDLPRYMGAWHVIACVDNPVERNFTNPIESYSLRPDHRSVDVTFHWHEKTVTTPRKEHVFKGKVQNPGVNTEWKMKLFPLFAATYLIVDVGPQYEWAAVAHPSRKFGWVLARNPRLPDSKYRSILEVFKREGYDTAKFIKLQQTGAE